MRRILLATDGSENALGASKYLADLYKGTSDVEVTVLHISPPVPPIYREEGHDPQIRRVYAAWKRKKEQEAKRYIEEAQRVLMKGGIKRNQINAKYAHQIVGVARDILREADAGHYDACVIGKKGTGWFDDMFLGSITSKLLEISENHPIWLVSSKKWNSRKVLVAMDHTAQIVQLAKYVGQMFQGLEGVRIRFYHYFAPFIEDLTSEEKKKMKEFEKRVAERERDRMFHFFGEAQRVLEDLGFRKNQVEYEIFKGESASPKKVSQRILKEVQDGNHGTLVIGRKGATGAREFRLGSVAWRIATESQNCAVWVV
ncbi:MAG: universal stress protein [Syntrophaceae bacterium]|nr:universal stress protein [Syntrophaceae bacterium]